MKTKIVKKEIPHTRFVCFDLIIEYAEKIKMAENEYDKDYWYVEFLKEIMHLI